jgi:hypothetical protein
MTSTNSTSNGWDALRKRLDNLKKPVQTFRLCEDADIRERYLKAKRAAEQADEHLANMPQDGTYDADALALLQKQAKDASAELVAARTAYDAATITLRFTALERAALEGLQKKHPATEEEEASGQEFAFDSFAPELIAAASLDGMPVDDARHFLDTWTPADAQDLWNAAWSAQYTKRTDLGKG